jgi:ATP-dependent Clp protease ATP-binding subunit ClpA
MGNVIYGKNVIYVMTSNLGLSDPVNMDDKLAQMQVAQTYQLFQDGDEDQLTYEVNRVISRITRKAVDNTLSPDLLSQISRAEPLFFKWLHPDDARTLVDE